MPVLVVLLLYTMHGCIRFDQERFQPLHNTVEIYFKKPVANQNASLEKVSQVASIVPVREAFLCPLGYKRIIKIVATAQGSLILVSYFSQSVLNNRQLRQCDDL